jgi:hypothetical protein
VDASARTKNNADSALPNCCVVQVTDRTPDWLLHQLENGWNDRFGVPGSTSIPQPPPVMKNKRPPPHGSTQARKVSACCYNSARANKSVLCSPHCNATSNARALDGLQTRPHRRNSRTHGRRGSHQTAASYEGDTGTVLPSLTRRRSSSMPQDYDQVHCAYLEIAPAQQDTIY